MHDELLRLLGTTGNPVADVAASADGTGVYFGDNRGGVATLRVAGDVTGTNPTLDVVLQASDAIGGSYTTIATFPQVIDEMVGYIATATPRPEVPGETPLHVAFMMPAGKPWLRVSMTVGGTGTPTFNDVSVEVRPTAEAVIASGVL